MHLNFPSLGNLVPEARCGMFHVARFQIYWISGTNDMVFASTLIWYHLPVMCMQTLPLLYWMNSLLIRTYVYSIFAFQKLLPSRNHIPADWIQQDRVIPVKHKEYPHKPHREKDNFRKGQY